MMEIAAAISLATSTFNALKKGMAAGREIEDMMGYYGKWFEAKDQIVEAGQISNNQPLVKKLFAGQSVEAQALEVTMAKHKIEKMEKELREFLIYTGQSEFYNDMMRERRTIRQARLAESKRKAERKKLIMDVAIVGITCLITVIGIVAVFTAILN